VPEGVTLPAELSELHLAAGRYACATYKGPYAGLPDAWSQLMGSWLPKSNQRVGNGESFEIYRNDPSTAKPEDLVTELYVSLA
jgi:AraC family transcriptional regulator